MSMNGGNRMGGTVSETPQNSMGNSSSKAGTGPIDTYDPLMRLLRHRIIKAHSRVLDQWSGDNHNLGQDVSSDSENFPHDKV